MSAEQDTGVENRSTAGGSGTLPGLRVVDVVSIIIGIVIGTAIFRTAPMVFQSAGSPGYSIGVWLLGGLLAYCGALCYAELGTTFPRNGGDYEYLTRAYGRWVGFFFGWSQLTVILAGNIGTMAYAFADYAAGLTNRSEEFVPWIAAAAVVLVTALNLAGIVAGRALQNVLSIAKIIGLSAIIVAGVVAIAGESSGASDSPANPSGSSNLGLALVFVMFAYGGWNDTAFVAAEVREGGKNLPRALFLGLAIVTAIYVAINIVYLEVLGFAGACQSKTPAADVAQLVIGDTGESLIRVLVLISALGAINGLILTGSRIFAAFGHDNRALAKLGQWNFRSETPIMAFTAQAVMTVLTILMVGTRSGQQAVDQTLAYIAIPALPWEKYFGGFDTLVAATAPTFWFFFFLTGLSVVILRRKTPPDAYRYRIPWYPIPVVLFCGSSLFMLYKSIVYAEWLSLLGLLPVVAGIPLGFLHRTRSL